MSTFTPNKSLEQPANNSDVDTWDVPVNANMSDIDIALGGSTLLNATTLSGTVALTLTQYRPFALLITGAPTAALNYQIPSGVGGFWSVFNGTTGGFQISVGSAAGGSAVNIPVGTSVLITCDGSASGMRVASTPVAVAGGATTQVQYNSSGVLAGSANLTFDGTTLAGTGLNIGGNAVIGLNAGSTLTLNGTAITAPNGVNINAGALFLTGSQLGVGTTSVGGNSITAAGLIQSLSGGFKFPDGSTQATAAAPGTSPGGATGNVQFNSSGAFAGQSNFTFNTGTGVLTVPALGITTPLAITMGGTGGTTATGTGAVVRATSPTLVTPTLGAATATSLTGPVIATKMDQQTGTSAAVVVTPSQQQSHASAAKAWVSFDAAGNISASYNVASVVNSGTATYVITFIMPFASTAYVALPTIVSAFNGALVAGSINTSASVCTVTSINVITTAGQANAMNVAFFGAQ